MLVSRRDETVALLRVGPSRHSGEFSPRGETNGPDRDAWSTLCPSCSSPAAFICRFSIESPTLSGSISGFQVRSSPALSTGSSATITTARYPQPPDWRAALRFLTRAASRLVARSRSATVAGCINMPPLAVEPAPLAIPISETGRVSIRGLRSPALYGSVTGALSGPTPW